MSLPDKGKAIVHWGVNGQMSYLLRKQIILTNQISLFFIVFIFVFVILEIGIFQHFARGFISLLGILHFLIVLLLNKLNKTTSSRFVLAFFAPFVLMLSSTFPMLYQPETIRYFDFIIPDLVRPVFVVLPLLIFSQKEEAFMLWFNLIFYLLGMWYYELIRDILNVNAEHFGFERPEFYYIKMYSFIMWLVLVTSFIFLKNINFSFEKKLRISNETLLEKIVEIEEINQELLAQQEEIKQQKNKIEQQTAEIIFRNGLLIYNSHVILNLAKNKNIQLGFWKEALREILETTANALPIHRVSIWQYDALEQKISCLLLYSLKDNQFSKGIELFAKDYPAYFKSLLKEEIIRADEATINPSTKEFKESYLEPNQILSMLDVPLFIEGKFWGIICHEEQYQHRYWTTEDVVFAKSVADIIVIAYKSMQRRKAEELIQQQKEEIQAQNEELIQSREQIIQINDNLEKTIKKRTKKLKVQNKKLAEYAYLNAHKLRSPLASMMGLINLIEENNHSPEEKKQLVQYLKASAQKLDKVIHEINRSLEKEYDFDKED